MKTKLPTTLAAVCFAIAATSSIQAANIDLSTWTQEGPSGNGDWQVSTDGSTVLQRINGNPTFFVSPEYFINNSFKGKFGVETTYDDDYIGFALFEGADASDPFLLFDWKQGLQSSSQPGFYLSKVTGGASAIPFGNHHLDAPGYDVLATNLGTGWADNTVYDFTLNYTTTNLKIEIAGGAFGTGQTIFDLDGTYNQARFGFYNYSQSVVRYEGFTEDVINVPDSGATGLALAGAFALLVGLRRKLR